MERVLFYVRMMYMIIYIIIFALGLAWGSFLNVVEWRTHAGTSWLGGRSQCPSCRTTIAWQDLVPVMSFLLLGGKCRGCKKSISLQYPVVELLMGLIAVVLWYFHGAPLLFMRDFAVVSILALIFITDLKYMYVHESFVLITSAALFIIFGIFEWHSWDQMIVGAAVGAGFFLFQYLISRGKWIGRGDISIGALMGVVLGWSLVPIALLIAYILGACIEGTRVLMRKQHLKDCVAFGTYLTVGTFITMIGSLLQLYGG